MGRKWIGLAISIAALAASAAAQTGTIPLDSGTPPSGLTNSNITVSNGNVDLVGSNNPEQLQIQSNSTGGHNWGIASWGTNSGFNAGGLGFGDFTAGFWRMYIDGSGNVGIGTTAPGALLDAEAGNSNTVATFGANGSAEDNRTTISVVNTTTSAGGSDSARISLAAKAIPSGGTEPPYWELTTDQYRNGSNNIYFFNLTKSGASSYPFYINGDLGYVGIGTTSPGYGLDVSGQIHSTGGVVYSDGTKQTTAWTGVLCGGDYAEAVDGEKGKHFQPGDVLVVSSDDDAEVQKSAEAYSTLVAGIYATKPGVVGRRQTLSNSSAELPMAMVGIVPTKVTAENGPIHKGDLLVTSTRMGYAMRGTDRSRMLGAVLGKAMGTLNSGAGVIEVLVTLQ